MKKKTALLVLMAWLALGAAALAQAPADPNLVYVPVAVTGQKNAYIKGLKKENFKLLEDGIEQTVVAFGEEDQGADIDIILALSALQRGRATLDSQKIREALENFRQQSPKSKIVVEELNFGANGLYAAIDKHITTLHERSTNPRRLLIVLTDGFEASGGEPVRALQEYAKKLSVPIYLIFAKNAQAPSGMSNDITEVGRGQQTFLSGGAGYEDLTRFTGGRFYEVQADTQLKSQLDNLAQEFKSQYVLGFKSTNDARDDKWRKIEVKMASAPAGVNLKDLKTKVRDRYFVAKKK